MPEKHHKNRTYGLSLAPELRERAETRASALGLTFSRYTSLCLEAELTGFAQILREDTLDLDRVLARAREYLDAKTRSIDFESDVASLLDRARVTYERHARFEFLRCDFALRQPSTVRDAPYTILLECRHNIRRQYALALGQAILLRSLEDVDAVLVAVPYVEGLDALVRRQFEQHGIRITTPDQLLETLEEAVMDLQSEDLRRSQPEPKPARTPRKDRAGR